MITQINLSQNALRLGQVSLSNISFDSKKFDQNAIAWILIVKSIVPKEGFRNQNGVVPTLKGNDSFISETANNRCYPKLFYSRYYCQHSHNQQ